MNANLLLVEDHDDTRAVLAKVLQSRGFHVESAGSGAEALKLASQHPFDFVLMDHGLPDGNGCAFMEVLHNVHHLDGIAITANAYESDEQLSQQAGFLAHVSKPVDAGKLCGVIEKCLNGRAS